MDLIQETLLELLEANRPGSLLSVGKRDLPCIRTWLDHDYECDVTRLAPGDAAGLLPSLGRFEYVFVTDTLEILDVDQGSALLARLRDIHCHRFAVTCAQGCPGWAPDKFLALALSLHRRIAQDGRTFCVYTHDIDTYNRERDWNTPEHWAHPRNFQRYRW